MRRLFLFVPVFILLLFPSLGAADGGALRLREQKGDYQIAIFTSPTPPRVGPIDISVLVQDAASGDVIDVPVVVTLRRHGSSIDRPATKEAATNKLYRAALFELPEPGWYSVEVWIGETAEPLSPLGRGAGVRGESPKTMVSFEFEAAEPLPSWLAMSPWVGWPLLAVLIFGVHQVLVRRSVLFRTTMTRQHATHRSGVAGG